MNPGGGPSSVGPRALEVLEVALQPLLVHLLIAPRSRALRRVDLALGLLRFGSLRPLFHVAPDTHTGPEETRT
jgi:hypothetical protein